MTSLKWATVPLRSVMCVLICSSKSGKKRFNSGSRAFEVRIVNYRESNADFYDAIPFSALRRNLTESARAESIGPALSESARQLICHY